MKRFENDRVEFKREYTDDLKKEIVAMANTLGGKIFVGIDDFGDVVGINDFDDMSLRISNSLRDCVKPDVSMFVKYNRLEEEGKTILEINVQQGSSRPYYLVSKGLRPDGVYVRQGSSCVCASEYAIREMIKQSDGDSFESLRCLNQNLSFEYLSSAFRKKELELTDAKMRTLHILDMNGMYTNLALLLSDQCPHMIKAATFSGTLAQQFQDSREFSGSLLRQLDEAYAYLEMRNRLASDFEGLYRKDRREYPPLAIREALVNAITHRDYSTEASTLIKFFSDHVEIVSLGGLVSGLSISDLDSGISVCRNPNLAEVFHRLNLIEAYGTGITKIMESYRDFKAKPLIEATDRTFKISLPSCLFTRQTRKESEEYIGEPTPRYTANAELRVQEKSQIMAMARSKGYVTRKDLESQIGLKPATAVRVLNQLVDAGKLKSVGNGRSTVYILP